MERFAEPHIIEIPKIADPRGNLSFVQFPEVSPFHPGEVEWFYDIMSDSARSPWQSFDNHLMIVCVSGAFDVVVKVDSNEKEFRLDRCYRALFIPERYEFRIKNFVTNSAGLIIKEGKADADKICEAPTDSVIQNSHIDSNIDDVRVITLDINSGKSGKSSGVINGDNVLPFDVRRIFYLYDVPAASVRGGHSHYQGRELIVAVSGAFQVELDDGMNRRRWTLDRPFHGLYVPTGLWRVIDSFSGGAVCMVLTSTDFKESDYVRSYDDFLRLTAPKRQR